MKGSSSDFLLPRDQGGVTIGVKVKRLYKLAPAEVSLVPRGANKKKFLIFKEDTAMDQELTEKISKGDPEKMSAIEKVIKDYMASTAGAKDEAGNEKKPMSEHAQTALKAAARILMAFKDEMPEALTKQVMSMSGMNLEDKEDKTAAMAPEEAQGAPEDQKLAAHKVASEAYKNAYKQELGKLNGAPPEGDAPKEKPTNEGGVTAGNTQEEGKHMSQPVTKADGSLDLSAVPEAVRPAVELIYKSQQEAVQKAAKLEGELKHEREQRVLKEFNEKAAQYKNLGDTKELATVLKSLTEAAPEAAAKVETILKAADERIEKSKLFAEIGSSLPGHAGNAEATLEAAAQAYVAKSGEKVSKEEAMTRFLETSEGQKAYAEFKNQRGGV